MKNILVIKNDRLGDFAISLPALNLILNKYRNDKITFVLSDINFDFSFLFIFSYSIWNNITKIKHIQNNKEVHNFYWF